MEIMVLRTFSCRMVRFQFRSGFHRYFLPEKTTGWCQASNVYSGTPVAVLEPWSWDNLLTFPILFSRSRDKQWSQQWWLWIRGWSKTCYLSWSLWNLITQYRRAASTGQWVCGIGHRNCLLFLFLSRWCLVFLCRVLVWIFLYQL